jgi:superfamily II DNA or RNA helicase
MTGVTKVAGEWSQDQVTERGMKITGDIVMEWIKKTNEIFGGPRKTVVFCAGVAHGRDLERQFAQQGYNFKSISYLEDDEYKREIIEEFSHPDSQIHGLIATDILTKGFDVPDVMIGVSARPFSKSFTSHVQQMGRVMRPYKDKQFGVWLDHSGNYLRFRKDWDKLFDEGVTDLESGGESTKKEPTEREKKDAKCPSCGALWVAGESKCVECGHEKPIRGIATVPGEMQELFGEHAVKMDINQDFYSQLVYYSRMRGYKDGWAAHKYKEKFGTFPNGLATTPVPITQKTVNWIRSRQIAWAKGQRR